MTVIDGRKKLAHLVLQTTQLPVLRDWYLEVLDAHIVYENQALAFLTFDDEHHRLAIAQIPGLSPRTPTTVGLSHSAYTFDDLGQLLEKFERLSLAGIQPHVPVQHGVTTSIYYRDPDGNLVELQIDNFATPDEATGYMNGPEYCGDPIGPSFEPDIMLTAYRSGTAESVLRTRAWAHECDQRNVMQLMVT
ncbi:VOC family protein [Mycobacterium sp. 236(2023)]|uniref:VOC family protein n=1 Tax=Mycobacterium sp. 236(2023) TaxID=3038163 RepID=UPI00241570D1|nr:VOC family protein [Mycobacterium sp. 236(2023)]MDG4668124.1 VOC family protein [Mycobacterium sp. 236(2023)]